MAVLLPADLAEKHGQRIVKLVHYALFERNDGIVGDANLLGADLRATFGDVAETETKLILEKAGAVAAVERMHFEARNTNEVAMPRQLFLPGALAETLTHGLA